MKKKLVVYTTITGDYEGLYDHTYINPNWDYVCFTDNLSIRSNFNTSWKLRPLEFDKMDSIRNQRWHKLHPHILFPEYEKSLWLDGSIDILNDGIFKDVKKVIEDSRDLAVALHPKRVCIYDEMVACINAKKDTDDIMQKQVAIMKANGFPKNYGLFETGIMYRNHHQDSMKSLMELWWHWIEKYSYRDQLSLTYCLWKKNIKAYPLSSKFYNDSDDRRIVIFPHSQNFRKQTSLLTIHNRDINKSIQEKNKQIEEKDEHLKEKNKQIEEKDQQINLMMTSKFWKLRNYYVYYKNKITQFLD